MTVNHETKTIGGIQADIFSGDDFDAIKAAAHQFWMNTERHVTQTTSYKREGERVIEMWSQSADE